MREDCSWALNAPALLSKDSSDFEIAACIYATSKFCSITISFTLEIVVFNVCKEISHTFVTDAMLACNYIGSVHELFLQIETEPSEFHEKHVLFGRKTYLKMK